MKTEIEEELKQRNKELLILNTIISFINQFLNIGELLENALEKVLEIMTIESGALLLLNGKKDVFLLETSKGFSPDFVSKISRIDAEENIIGRTICSGNQIMLGEGNTINKDASEWLFSQDFNTLLCLPIKTKKRVYGMMMCGHRYSLFFNKRNTNILENIGYQIAISIENALLYKEAKESEEKYHHLLESANIGIISLSKEGEIFQFNKKAEEIFGYSRDEVAKKQLTELLSEKQTQLIETMTKQYMTLGNDKIFDQTIVSDGRKKNGKEIQLEISYSIWGDRHNPVITATVKDIEY